MYTFENSQTKIIVKLIGYSKRTGLFNNRYRKNLETQFPTFLKFPIYAHCNNIARNQCKVLLKNKRRKESKKNKKKFSFFCKRLLCILATTFLTSILANSRSWNFSPGYELRQFHMLSSVLECRSKERKLKERRRNWRRKKKATSW